MVFIMSNYLASALAWFAFSFCVIPLVPGTKRTSVKWSPWINGLCKESIKDYWAKHPDHELGFIVDEKILVLDADTPESVAALYQLEKSFDINPTLTVTTSKGVHHYYRRAAGTFAKMDSHSSAGHPERLDVKTGRGNGQGRSMVVLAPSPGKSVDIDEANNINELVEIDQRFIDAVFRHNGREAPRQQAKAIRASSLSVPSSSANARKVKDVLKHISSDCGYQDWFTVLAAVYHTLDGSEEGFAIADGWSCKGANYGGSDEVRAMWASFSNHSGTPITFGTLCKMASDNGADISDIALDPADRFEIVDTVTVEATEKAATHDELSKFSLTGLSSEYEKKMLADVFVLGKLALLGQWTVIYAQFNTGKTLLTLYLLMEAINAKSIDAKNVFYINADDNHVGLTEKLKIAEEYGFHMIAPGHRGYKAKDLLPTLRSLATKGKARNVIIILDTLKKFADLMDKSMLREFGEVIRMFISQGGTIIALAHVNKKRDADGKAIYAGTSDIIDDADCVYVLDTLDEAGGIKTVEFENKKNRGRVASRAAYSYIIEDGISYLELLSSITTVDDIAASDLRAVSAEKSVNDAAPIEIIKDCIGEGVNSKMKMASEASERSGVSKRAVLQTIERFTGDDPSQHHWNFKVVARGAKQFYILEQP